MKPANIIKTKSNIKRIVESKRPASRVRSLAEAQIVNSRVRSLAEAQIVKRLDTILMEGGKGGKIGMFKAAAVGIGAAAAFKILASMFGGPEGYYGPIGAGVDPNDDFVPRVADFGPNLFPDDPQKPNGGPPDHEDFW